MKAPGELHDHSGVGEAIIAIRIDGPEDTRGKARAFFAQEHDVDFTAVRVRRTAYRLHTQYIAEARADGMEESYDGWPWVECSPDAPDAHPFWAFGLAEANA